MDPLISLGIPEDAGGAFDQHHHMLSLLFPSLHVCLLFLLMMKLDPLS